MAILREEMECKCGCGLNNTEDELLVRLNDAQMLATEYADSYVPFVITSGTRCGTHNEEVGGVPDSAHIWGYAADIACDSSATRLHLIKALLDAGFNRIEIYATFVHADVDPNKAVYLGI